MEPWLLGVQYPYLIRTVHLMLIIISEQKSSTEKIDSNININNLIMYLLIYKYIEKLHMVVITLCQCGH